MFEDDLNFPMFREESGEPTRRASAREGPEVGEDEDSNGRLLANPRTQSPAPMLGRIWTKGVFAPAQSAFQSILRRSRSSAPTQPGSVSLHSIVLSPFCGFDFAHSTIARHSNIFSACARFEARPNAFPENDHRLSSEFPLDLNSWFDAGFTKKDDLKYFTKAICHIDYVHLPVLAPTAEILDPYKKAKNGDWPLYERKFLDLMKSRRIEETAPRDILDGGCLLCSEEKPQHCHRRLVSECLKEKWGDVQIEHIP